jgi:type I restriction enzyme S subunit
MERFELPEGWEWRALGDVCRVVSGATPKTDRPEFWGGDIRWATPKDLGKLTGIEISETDRRISKEGYVACATQLIPAQSVLLTSRAPIGNLAINTVPMATNQGFKSLVPSEAIETRFLYWALKHRIDDLIHLGRGGTFAEVSKGIVAKFEIPVPPIPEQKRLIGRIEAQTCRVEAIRKAQDELIDDMRGTLAGYYAEITADAEWKPLGEVAPQARRPVTVQAGHSYPELGIRSFGKGTFHKPAISAEQLGSKRLFHIHPGDLIFNNVFAWEGAVAVVKPEDAGRVGSHRFITCVPKPGVATTPFLYFHFTTEQGLHDLGDASPGGAGRNRTLGLKNLATIRVPVPSHAKQVVFARLWDKVETTRRLQAELKADLAAYVPSLLAKAFRGAL